MKRAARAPVLIWLLFLLLCAAVTLRTRFTADLSAFLPRAPTPAQQILVDQLREGAVSRLMLLAIENAPAEKLAGLSESLADVLARDKAIAYVNNGAQARIEADGRFLIERRYLLSPGVTPQRFTVAGLRAALEQSLDLLASPMSALIGQLLPRDPTGEFLLLLDALQLEGGPNKQEGVWFSANGARALLILQTQAAGFDTDAQELILRRVHAGFAAVARELGEPQAKLLVSGPGVFAVASRAAIKQDASRISLLAMLLVSALLYAAYRSLRVLTLILLPVASGALAGIAAVSLAFGSVHGVTLGFGATLLGEGVDYAIYLFTNAAGRGVAHAGMKPLWRTLRLGVLTSICGFGVMLLSDFQGLAQLGLFSMVGLIVAFGVTRFVLPGLLPETYAIKPLAVLGALLLRWAVIASRLRYPLLIAAVLCATWLVLRGERLWDDRLESLSPLSQGEKQLDEQLRRELGAPDVRHLVVISRPSRQAALEAAERLEVALHALQDAGALTGFDSPARTLPSEHTQRQRLQALPEDAVLKARLAEAMNGLPFRAQSFEPFLRDVTAARRGPLLNPDDLSGGLALRLDALLVERHGQWQAMLALRGVKDARALSAAVAATQLPDVHVLDLKQATDEMYRGYRGQAAWFALLGAGVIVALLFTSLRSARRTLEVLAPLAISLLVTCTLLTLGGGRLTLFHLVGMLLVVGLGSNYTLFFERKIFRSGDPQRTLAALALCNLSTVIGFGLLGLARAPVLSAIGSTVALGAFLSLVIAAILAQPLTATSPPSSHHST